MQFAGEATKHGFGERFTRSAVACQFSFLPVSRAGRRGAFCDRRRVLETRDIRGGELVCAIAWLDFHTSDLCPCRLRGPPVSRLTCVAA
jgi:hypothetical protein